MSDSFCNPMDCSLPGSSVHGILQARILEWVAILFSRASSQPRDKNWASCIAGRFFTIWATDKSNILIWFNIKWCLMLIFNFINPWSFQPFAIFTGEPQEMVILEGFARPTFTSHPRPSRISRSDLCMSATGPLFAQELWRPSTQSAPVLDPTSSQHVGKQTGHLAPGLCVRPWTCGATSCLPTCHHPRSLN